MISYRPSLGERVAIKVMENVAEVLEEVEQEYLILRDLGAHPGMPAFHGIYFKQNKYISDQVWIVMEVSVTKEIRLDNVYIN